MSQTLTFVRPSGSRRFAKRYLAEHTEPYPQVSRLSSSVETATLDATGLRKKFDLYVRHAKAGDALMKGNFTKELKNESRAGHTDVQAHTNSIIIDIDDFVIGEDLIMPLDEAALRKYCEHVVGLLPIAFQNVSYIGHASSSFGTKKGTVSLHIEFGLTTPVAPRALKNFLLYLNYTIPEFSEQMVLTATGTGLRYVVDPCLADNSRIVYIANPEFVEPRVDPFVDPEDRFTLVEKGYSTASIRDLLPHASIDFLAKEKRKRVKDLRAEGGLAAKKEQVAQLKFNGNYISVVKNPDAIMLEYAYHTEEFVYYNLHTSSRQGDSKAYYVRQDNPEVVFNFKNEPYFRFKDADEEAYIEHCTRFVNEDNQAETQFRPLVFRDFASNTFYNGLLNTRTRRLVEVAETTRSSVDDFMQQHGEIAPDIIETVDFVFRPHDERATDMTASPRPFVNKFTPTEYMVPDKDADPIPHDKALGAVEKNCPTIYKILHSVVGNDEEALLRFLNWLAVALQTRTKTQTAWIFQGVMGTGKGVLGSRIIAPLFGTEYTKQLTLAALEEQFNSWVEQALVAVVDEFTINDSRSGQMMMNKIKNFITEPTLNVRAMRQNNRNIENYTNFIFFSNQHEVMLLEEHDRRFNVAPRQEIPLVDRYPNIQQLVSEQLPKEVEGFGAILSTLELDRAQASQPLLNSARNRMIELSTTTIDQFVDAVRNGDIGYFAEVLEIRSVTGRTMDYIHAAKTLVKTWIRDSDSTGVWVDELMPLYNMLVGKCESPRKLSKMFRVRGLEPIQVKRGGLNRWGFKPEWNFGENSREMLLDTYFSAEELQASADPALQALGEKKQNVVPLRAAHPFK